MLQNSPDPAAGDPRRELRADCARCAGLCCVAPAFARSADFAIDKPAGRPCVNLASDDRCTIHPHLRERGFVGCAVFDCFGAGQQTVQVTFAGDDWRREPAVATSMFAVFAVIRQLKELLWYLAESVEKLPAGPLREEVVQVQGATGRLVAAPAADLEALDAAAHRSRVGPLLGAVSEAVREGVSRPGRDRVGADLIGADLTRVNLRGASLRGGYLLGADLRGADLHRTDLLGVDLRGADLCGAQMIDSLFLTQPQVQAARGDRSTRLPALLSRPQHWLGTAP
ncbi:MAG: pentapeptide repeat-containing protein [Mycobacteriaceae bacterium]